MKHQNKQNPNQLGAEQVIRRLFEDELAAIKQNILRAPHSKLAECTGQTASTPEVTGLEAAILRIISGGERSANEIRKHLRDGDVSKTRADFYELMGRMEEDSLIDGFYVDLDIGLSKSKERRYRITSMGKRAYAAFTALQSNPTFALNGVLNNG